MPDEHTPEVSEFFERLWSLIDYWDTHQAPNLKTTRDRLEGLAFSLCVQLDDNGDPDPDGDVELHDLFESYRPCVPLRLVEVDTDRLERDAQAYHDFYGPDATVVDEDDIEEGQGDRDYDDDPEAA